MLTRLLENWPYKLAALAIAIALHIYVSGVNDPHTARQITLPLTLSRVPEGMVVVDSTPSVTLQASGPASSLDSLTASNFTATVDLRAVRVGVNQPLPIHVTAASGVGAEITIESQTPREASVTMETKRRERFTVHASFRRVAPVGFSYEAPLVMPPVATVEGPESAVARVSRLVIFADDVVSGDPSSPGVLDGVGAIVPVDAQQEPVAGLTCLPAQAEVRVPVQSEAASKDLLVSANVTGTPAYPAQVVGVDVQPSRISVMGAPSALANSSVVTTAPVDVSGAISDVRRAVAATVPDGLTPVRSATVVVTVHIAVHRPSPAPNPSAQPPVAPAIR